MKTIGIFNPSSPSYSPINMEKINAWFKEKGFDVAQATHLFSYERFLSGTDKERASDVMELFKDKNIDLMLAMKGGYGSARILDLLDFDEIKKNKKPLIGFSDTTALQLGLWAKAGLKSWTGLSPRRDIADAVNVDKMLEKSFDLVLKNGSISLALQPLSKKHKDVSGALIGGTLSLVSELIGTAYQPDFKNCLLFLEDVMEEPYKIDRMLTQLRLAGVFDQVAGVIFGDFYKCISSDENDGLMVEVLMDLSERLPNVQMWTGLPYGHSDTRIIMPIGSQGQISKDTLSFEYDLFA
ncbi:MAG: LD-carboxypeptidase [Alphaproteobacteria bacterium]|nr:LD-carboxypeptidase [Alphaproteobacteria bacterium]